MRLLERLDKRFRQRVNIYRVTQTAPDPLTGAADHIRLQVLDAPCSLQAQRRIARTGEVPLSAGVPLEPPAYKCYLGWAPLPPVPYEALEVWVGGLRYPLQRPPIDVAGQGELLELHLGAPQEGTLDTTTVRRGTVALELQGPIPTALPGSSGLAYALVTPVGGNAGDLEYTLNGTLWQPVAALLELEGADVQAVRLRTSSLEPLAVRVDYY